MNTHKPWQGRRYYTVVDNPTEVIEYLGQYESIHFQPFTRKEVEVTTITVSNYVGIGRSIRVIIDDPEDWLIFTLRFPVTT